MSVLSTVPESPGVYSLLRGNEILYIGKAKNMRARVSAHTDLGFDSVRYLPCPENELNQRERQAIQLHKPPLNRRLTGVSNPKTKAISISVSIPLLAKARARAKVTDRGNLSAYIERCFNLELTTANRKATPC
jgi:excinuclease UvrABC nuclease subunit